MRSVSKSLGPDLRLAVLAGDATTVSRVEGRQLVGTGWVSRILQQIVAAFWSDAGVDELLRRAEETYAARRLALVEALAARGIESRGRSGLNVYVPVADETTVVAGLLERGWAVTPCERWRIRSSPAIRITAATLPVEEADAVASDVLAALQPRVRTYSA